MSKIDDIKTKITDQEYKQLCDEMMELNKKHKDLYEITYIYPVACNDRYDDGESNDMIELEDEKIFCNVKNAFKYIRMIERSGFCKATDDFTYNTTNIFSESILPKINFDYYEKDDKKHILINTYSITIVKMTKVDHM